MIRTRKNAWALLILMLILGDSLLWAATPDELQVKSKGPFEFKSKPSVARHGDNYTITFETQAACDVTVAIEDDTGRILRHFASGVLGPKAPPPFKRNTLKQSILWDGKDDQGKYLDAVESLTVRVSLGLKPSYEKDLYRSDKKRFSREAQLIVPQPEGVYVYDGGDAMDYLRLFDHEGNYVRTIYPFPANQVKNVKGLMWHTAIQDGSKHPVKGNFLQNTLLTAGTNSFGLICYEPKAKRYRSPQNVSSNEHYGMYGRGATSMDVRKGRIALTNIYLNRMGTDGSSGGMTLTGPQTAYVLKQKKKDDRYLSPRSVALSPDGKTLYLTGYVYARFQKASADIILNAGYSCINAVYKLSMDGDAPKNKKLFAGSDKPGVSGKGDTQLNYPSSVAVDAKGLVYVSDYLNHRIQVFKPDGALARSIAVQRPAQISLDEKRNMLYVFSYMVHNDGDKKRGKKFGVPLTLTRFENLSSPKKKDTFKIPTVQYNPSAGWYRGHPIQLWVCVNPYGKEPTLWLAEGFPREDVLTIKTMRSQNIRLYGFKNDKLVELRDFHKDVKQEVLRTKRPRYSRQRLGVNPVSGDLYVAEGDAYVWKSFQEFVRINPDTGKITLEPMPFDAEDFCFDHNGCVYLRSLKDLVRYNASTWQPVPWDYGEEREAIHTSSSSDRKVAKAISALALPETGGWHTGGMYVALNGQIVVGCGVSFEAKADRRKEGDAQNKSSHYSPAMYPGRSTRGRGGMPVIHIWDKHGQVVKRDAVPGLSGQTYGLGLDVNGFVYAMSSQTRLYDGKKYYNDLSGTLAKFVPGKTKIVTDGKKGVPLKLTDELKPKGEKAFGSDWVEGAEWFYGGVGWDGKNAGIGCGCWNARFTLDYFNRSFAPELDRYRVAVVDSGGNLILRVGQYGNADSQGPKSKVPLGGDEVGLVHGAYLATHTDKRLFIADPGNVRIVSVKLGYHREARVPLKSVKNQKSGE